MARTSINVPITGDSRPLRSELSEADGALSRFGSSAGRSLATFAGAVAAAFAVDKIADFGRSMFTLGQTLEQTNVKIDTVFGDSAAMVRAWADGLNEDFGLTDTKLGGLAAGMGDMLKPMGFTADQAAEMSTQFLELAGALSANSLGTRSVDEITEIFIGALTGEYDSLQRLGVPINAASVGLRAMEIATADGREEVTALDQAQAVLQLSLEGSTDALASWNDGSLDNIKTANELKAKFGELREEIAEFLYPAFVAVGEWIVDSFVPWIEGDLIPAVKTLWEWFDTKVVPVLGEVWGTLRDDVLPALSDFAEVVSGAVMVAGKSLWQQLQNIGGALGDLARDLGIFGGTSEENMARFEEAVIGTMVAIQLLGVAQSWVFTALGTVITAVVKAVAAVVREVVDLVNDLIEAFKTAWGWFDKILRAGGGGLFGSLARGGGVSGAWDAIKGLFGSGGISFPHLGDGGIVTTPTLALIGEAGPEAVVPLSQTGAMGGATVTINMPPGSSGEDVVQALERHVRRNGGLPSILAA